MRQYSFFPAMHKTWVQSLGNEGNGDLLPGSGRSPGEENGYPLQYFCLENFMDMRQATDHVVAKTWT